MKIGICFSGSIRDFTTCIPSLKKYVLNNLNADIFLHLWKMNDISSMNTNVGFKWRNDCCDESFVIDCLKPVSYVIDQYSDVWEDKILKKSGIDMTKLVDDKSRNYGVNACGMYYKISQSFKLLKDYSTANDVKYDLVIRARVDFIWEDHVTISDFIGMNDQHVYLIKDRYATHSKLETNDKFFAGSFDVMEKMCNLFENIKTYQSRELIIEGQTLHENHIKYLGLKVKWIGHSNTYYKCMARHRLHNNHKYILIDNSKQYDKICYELSYYLLYNNYNVVYLNQSDNPHIEVLKLFRNFSFHNPTFNLNKGIYCISDHYHQDIKAKQIIINYEDPKDQLNQEIVINVSQEIYMEELIDFVISLINIEASKGVYQFNRGIVIENIDIGEKVIFRYLDHGHYPAIITAYNPKTKKYILKFGKEKASSGRKNIKIFDLTKYIKNSSLMPINLHQTKTPI